jgi:hypothetical protein
VGDHSADGTVEDAGGSAEMEGTTGGVDNATLAEESVVLHCIRFKFENAVKTSVRILRARRWLSCIKTGRPLGTTGCCPSAAANS